MQVSAAYDREIRTPDGLLDCYATLTGWSAAMCRAGAAVTVFQRFRTDARIERDGATYVFVGDGHPPWLSTGIAPLAFCQAIAGVPPDVVHVNGLIFPKIVGGLRKLMGPAPAIVVQHHGGDFPVRWTGPLGRWRHWQWRKWLMAADAVSFTAAEQAQPWRDAGILLSIQVRQQGARR